jgi:hypothetical protein
MLTLCESWARTCCPLHWMEEPNITLTPRKRKLRCDAVRPTCTNCSKPRIRGAHAGEPPAPCTWDSALPAGIAKPKQPSRPESPVRVEGQEPALVNGSHGHKRARVDEVEDRSGKSLLYTLYCRISAC